MTKRENPRRKEREFNKFQERSNRGFRKKDENQGFKRDSRVLAPAKETNIDAIREDLVLGRNAVIEALKSDRTIECLYVSKGDLEGSIKVALGLACLRNPESNNTEYGGLHSAVSSPVRFYNTDIYSDTPSAPQCHCPT